MTDRAGRSSPRRRGGLARTRAAAAMALVAGGCSGAPFPPPEQGSEATAEAVSAAERPARRPDATDPALQPAPEVFAVEEWALWNGQRTLGGRWAALPDIDAARRVRLIGSETGLAVDGALIRREPGQAGPRLIISSEAAESLGLRPGVAAPVTIVALAYPAARKQPDEASAPPPEQYAAIESTIGADIETPGAEAIWPAEPGAASADAAGPLPPRSPEAPAAGPESGTARAAPGATESPDRPASELSVAPVTPVAQPEDYGSMAAAASGGVADGLPFIQAGIFGDPANAARLVGRLRAAGLPASERPTARGLTRVVIGPYRNVAERNRALETVRKIGPADAMPVRG